jgi:FAD/FMN-containing dehydrogenase
MIEIQVRYCTAHALPFLANSGTHGWNTKWNLPAHSAAINLQLLNKVTISPDRTRATIQGGALIHDVVNAAYNASTRVVTGNCNLVGHLGATLGGGYGHNMGLMGFAVDQLTSLDVVLGDGTWKRDVTRQSDPDLWFAMLGAGPNFGIVTAVTARADPTPQSDLTAWFGQLVFAPEKLEAVIEVVQALQLTPKMVLFIYFLTTGPPAATPLLLLTPLYHGSPADATTAFAPLLDLGPLSTEAAVLPWPRWNDFSDNPLSVKGGFKNIFAVGHDIADPATYRATWDDFVAFSSEPTAAGTGFVTEIFPHVGVAGGEEDVSGASFANRRTRFNSFIGPWYTDPALHAKAQIVGEAVRKRFRETGGLEKQLT